MRRNLEHTEILDVDFVEEVNLADKKKPKKNLRSKIQKYFKLGVYFLLVGVFAFESFQMMQVSAAVRDTSLDVEKEYLYQYEEVEFSNVDFSENSVEY